MTLPRHMLRSTAYDLADAFDVHERLSGAAQPPAGGAHPHGAPTGRGGPGGQDGSASLAVGTAADAHLGPGPGTLSVVAARGAADHRHHHAGRGAPHAPPATEARGGPTLHGSSACPPGSLGVVRGLSAPRASPTRLRPLPWGGSTL
jgi:hypothetical protein